MAGKKIKSANMDAIKVSNSKEPKESDKEETVELSEPTSDEQLIDFQESFNEDQETNPEQYEKADGAEEEGRLEEPKGREIEVEKGVVFKLDKYRQSTRKYISVVSIGTGDKVSNILKICKRVLHPDDRENFELWYYAKCDSITDAYEAWEDNPEGKEPPEEVDDWLQSFFNEFVKAIQDLLSVDNPKG